jgi:diketogulonate reductase-like aldo/keto reductase
MESSIKTSQERITEQTEGKSSLDVALLHSPYCWQGHCSPEEMKVTWMTAWRNLEEMKRKGRVDCIGVSNFDARLLQELLNIADAKVDIIQVSLNCQ